MLVVILVVVIKALKKEKTISRLIEENNLSSFLQQQYMYK